MTTTPRPFPHTRTARANPRRRSLPARIAATVAIVSVTAVPLSMTPAGAAPTQGDSLQQMQQKRQEVRNKKANQAAQVNALEASDAEVSAALGTLTSNVNAQQDRVEEAERAVARANKEHDDAKAAQAAKQAELDDLVAEMKSSAVDAYVSLTGGDNLAGTAASGDVNDTVNRRTLLGMKANENLGVAERFRSVQEDLEIERANAENAAARASQQQGEVASRLEELESAYAEQQAFAEQVEQRLDAALAEADSLAELDSQLSSSISAKQAEIAKAVAAQRAAQEERARRAAATQAASQAAKVVNSGAAQRSEAASGGGSSSGGGGGAVPSITGAGEIVSVGGIRVHNSIAGNLQSLLSAASAAGIHLSGGGYRDPSGQIAVRRNNCGDGHYNIYVKPASSCSPPTARPGSSMHERGLAIDFTQGGSTLGRGSSAFAWLKANAASYGFYNLPSEPWHWSTNGN